MKRRDFIKVSSAAGLISVAAPAYSTMSSLSSRGKEGFDLHPFIKAHPEAVFINLTEIENKGDAKGIHDAASTLAREMFVKTTDGEGYSNSTKITCKPNWTCSGPVDSDDPLANKGITTDLNFIEGFLRGVKAKGPQQFFIRECACPQYWSETGYTQMAERNNFDLRDLSTKDFWELDKEDVIFHKVDGVVFKQVGIMAPMTGQDTFLINIAKFKTHLMGLTAAIKNLQGITAKKFHQYCGGNNSIFKSYDKRYHEFFQPDYLERVHELYKKHLAQGIPRWDSRMEIPPYGGGLFMEQWVQRTIDGYSVTPTGINIVEGIYGHDGDGFTGGPHDDKPMDFMSNHIIFGKDAFRVDIITHWLAGHEPGNFGLFHIGIERGVSNVLNPRDIPVYLWNNGKATLVNLDTLKRTPLLTNYLRKNTKGQKEDKYHLCDEPFDYTAWRKNTPVKNADASIHALGTDSNEKVVMDVSVPEKGDVFVDILNKEGEIVWRLEAKDLEPGNHQVVWDGFSSPGLYNMYVKGMGWDAERQMVIYS